MTWWDKLDSRFGISIYIYCYKTIECTSDEKPSLTSVINLCVASICIQRLFNRPRVAVINSILYFNTDHRFCVKNVPGYLDEWYSYVMR